MDSNVRYEQLEKAEAYRDSSDADTITVDACQCRQSQHTRRPSSKRKWIRENFLKLAQLIVLIDIAILLTIDVTATLAARVRRSKTCAAAHHEVQVEVPQTKTSDFLDYTTSYIERKEWGMENYSPPFGQPPSDALDAAWKDLLRAKNIRLTHDEVVSLGANRTHKIRISNGDFVGVLGPYHQLHCLDIMRQLIHWDYYSPRMSEEELNSYLWTQHHSDHCIELFRENIMCHAEPTFYLGEWTADSKTFPNIELMPQGKAKCTDWTKLDEWARSRKLVEGEWKSMPGPFEGKTVSGEIGR